MGQINAKLRSVEDAHFAHWCPGCGEMHVIPNSWAFDGNFERPTINPSVLITGKKIVVDDDGEWTGEWVRDANGNAIDHRCHYFLHAGELKFCGDSLHALAGQTVSLPLLPSRTLKES